jgi:hypothetical protein
MTGLLRRRRHEVQRDFGMRCAIPCNAPMKGTKMNTNTEHHAELLKTDFLCTAEWRGLKAIEHPHDERNLKAVAALERLASTVDQIKPDVLKAYAELFEEDTVEKEVEVHNEMLRCIGFHWTPSTATEFVTEFISKVT